MIVIQLDLANNLARVFVSISFRFTANACFIFVPRTHRWLIMWNFAWKIAVLHCLACFCVFRSLAVVSYLVVAFGSRAAKERVRG